MTEVLLWLGGVSALALFFAGLWYLLQIIAYWKIFTKAGKPGWHSLIPFLNTYDEFDLSWNGLWGLVFLAIAFVVAYLSRSGAPAPGSETIVYVLSAALVILEVVERHKLSKSFGHGLLFTLGLILLPPFFMLWLGFGSDWYRGRQ